MKCINRQSVGQLSSFFPGRRDDIANSEDQEYLRMQRNGITVEPLNFPATQSVLWNRTAQGESETLHLTTKRNVRLYINEKTLRLAHRHVSQTKSSFQCFLVGSVSVDSREDSIDVTVDRFDPGREVLVNNGSGKVKRKVPTTVVPGDHIVPISLIQGLSGADSSVMHTKDEFHKAFQVLFGRMSSQEPVNLSHLVSLKVCCHSHGGDDEIIINVNCGTITMGAQIQATPVAPVPIIPTALARNLSGPLRLSEVQGMPKTGYLTMDHTRKLLLLLESDPKAFSLPLLGIWVSGTYSIHHPFIWACCLHFIYSTAIQQRVFAPPNSFLLLLYSPAKTTPEFWECCQDLGQSEEKMFEFYSCYENLHLEIPPNPSSSDPLCFELFPASEGMGRSLFEQAVEIWEKENKPTRLNQDGINPHQQPAVRQGSGEEEPSPEPRPSPSPHPQNLQFVLPDVAETSLSLSFDEQVPGERSEQGYVNQQFLAHPKLKQQQTKTEDKQKMVQHDQENGQMRLQKERSPGFFQEKQNAKQFRNNGVRQNSPSREPLKQILIPNQTHAKDMNQKQSSQKPHPTQGSAVFQKGPIRKGSGPARNMQERSPKAFTGHSNPKSKGIGKQPAPLKPNAVHEPDLKANQQKQKITTQKMRSECRGCEGTNGRALPNLPNQQISSSNQQDDISRGRQVDQQQLINPSDVQELDHNSCPLPVNQEQRPFLETVFEGGTPDGTLNKSMNESEFELKLNETSQVSQSSSILEHSQRKVQDADSESHSSGSAGLILDQGEKQSALFPGMGEQHGFVQTKWNTEISDKRFSQLMVCRTDSSIERLDNIANGTSEEKLGNTVAPVSNGREHQQAHKRERSQSKVTEKHTDEKSHEGTIPENNDFPAAVTRPDPYELLMKQDAQLRQLQEQIKLLLQQQLPTANPLLTPPRTPHFESSHGHNKPPANSPISMVTACTNTGASLLLGTPVKPRGKRSAATSPMKEKEMNHSAKRRSSSASSTETSQHNSKVSQKYDSTVNPEELANQMIELDDPSQTLASSLHAVDIPSFVESPSGVTSPSPHQAKRGSGMETSFTSPVLGESASILVEKRQNEGDAHGTGSDGLVEEESRGVKSNHVSLLQRNERQFYDNLLNQVKSILDQQPQEESSSEEPGQKDEQKEQVIFHEPTREEVVMATMKELQKIQSSTLETGNMEPPKSSFGTRQWPIYRSASLSAIPDHPHINYMSFSVDETLDEVFNETYLKYLTDNQLQELQEMRNPHKKHSRERAVTFSVLPEGRSALLRRGSVDKESLCDSSSISSTDYTWNNLSMATKEYLGKYCLATGQPDGFGGGSGELTEAKRVTDTSNESARSQTSVTSQGCKAPPCTPDPTNKGGNESQILDITRLKKLPKLF